MAELSKMSLDELEAAIKQKKAERRNELKARHQELSAQLHEVESELNELDGTAGKPRGGTGSRPKNSMSLREAIAKAIRSSKKGLTKDEIAEAVKADGYKSNSDNFGTIVYQTLYKHEEFVRNGNGKYSLAK